MYWYVPALVKVKEKLSPIPRGPLLNNCSGPMVGVPELAIWCWTVSRFVQVTFVPTGTVTVCGRNP